MSVLLSPVLASVRRFLEKVSTNRFGLIALSVVRMLFGVLILVDLVRHFGARYRLWGEQSWYTWDLFKGESNLIFGFFQFSGANWVVDLYYLVATATAVCLVLGIYSRIATPLMAILIASISIRNPIITNGGDNIVNLLLWYMTLCQTDAYFTLRWWKRRKAGLSSVPEVSVAKRNSAGYQALTLLHNIGWISCILQMCTLYMVAGLLKVQGQLWQEGTALYYVLHVTDFQTWPAISNFLAHQAGLMTFLTIATVFVQVSFPFSLLNRRACHIVFIPLVMMHLGIAFLMGLPLFSAFMIVGDLLVFTDPEWRSAWRRLKGLREAYRTYRSRKSEAGSGADVIDLSEPNAAIKPAAVS